MSRREDAEALVDGAQAAIGDEGTAEVIGAPAQADPAPGVWRRLLARVPRSAAAGEVGWVTISYAVGQAMRLATNIVLARLLAPQLFGIMLIVNTLRTGIELLSDIGISHNIISNPRGAEPAFFNTAYTLQIIRGAVLGVAVLVLAVPISRIYQQPELTALVPLMSVLFVLSALQAPSRFLMMKQGEVRAYAISDIALAVGSLVIHVALALYTRSIWALFLGLILTTALQSIVTHLLMERGVLKLQLDRTCMREILSFGKWVFVSSLIYFLAINYDRLYFAKAIPFAVLGVYGVARTFSDTATQLIQRVGSILIYPKIAASGQQGWALRAALAPVRARALLLIAVPLSLGVAVSDRVITLLYDARYHAAAAMLPVLMLGVWFSVLSTIGDAVMMGTGRPAHSARANLAKFVFTCAGLPLALAWNGMLAALLVIAGGDLVRYLSLALSERAHKVSFGRQDAALTLLLAGMVVVWRTILVTLGLAPDAATFWSYAATLHG